MKEFQGGCARPKAKVQQPLDAPAAPEIEKGVSKTMIQVGKPAPEFTAPGFYQGKFVEIDLADYRGKWIMLCFYPGDFTFV